VVRGLCRWFHYKFLGVVTVFLVTVMVYKRLLGAEVGGGPPDTAAIRAARHNIRYHLAYIGWLLRTRSYLAGDQLTYADFAAAAHLSAADYLGDVPWDEDEGAKVWYSRVKSRPSFRAILSDTLAGTPPSETYADLDF
jgi:glutathione S-transferase